MTLLLYILTAFMIGIIINYCIVITHSKTERNKENRKSSVKSDLQKQAEAILKSYPTNVEYTATGMVIRCTQCGVEMDIPSFHYHDFRDFIHNKYWRIISNKPYIFNYK